VVSSTNFIVTRSGKPFALTAFSNWVRLKCNEARLPHCSAHGLRKAAARRLAEAGCSQHEIAAITGHSALKRSRDDPSWASVKAVRDGRVHLSPKMPFGWVDFPPSVNRLIGLWWLAKVLYPDKFSEDTCGR
jgi:hypothetical protein